MHILQWLPANPPRITNLIMRSMDRHIARFKKEFGRRPCCGVVFLNGDLREVVGIDFEPDKSKPPKSLFGLEDEAA
jgi:hypothetical protein